MGVPQKSIYGSKMTRRVWVRLPDLAVAEIEAIADAEAEQNGERPEVGTIVRRLVIQALRSRPKTRGRSRAAA